ncbi:MAG: ECF transporter S component, partial [Anaerolineae bacterium]|nr:ECF transporter S component [Anaerolineae bacterium]
PGSVVLFSSRFSIPSRNPLKEEVIMEGTQTSPAPAGRSRLGTFDLAVAGIFGALAIVLSFTPLGLIPVPNPTEAATSLHLPAIVAAILAGPIVGGLVGLVLAISSWLRYSGNFIMFAGGNVFVGLLAAFLPRILIGVVAYYVYRLLRRWPALAAGAAGVAGTLVNSVGVLGLLIWLGVLPVELLAPVFAMNVPIEIALALVVTIPVVAALRAVGRGRIAADKD